MIVLHHLNNSRSQRVLWLLEELGLDYEIRRYQRDPKTMLAPAIAARGTPARQVADHHRWIAAPSPSPAQSSNTWSTATAAAGSFPRRGTPERLRYTYWLHYAEGSAMPPLLLKLVFDRIETAPMPFFCEAHRARHRRPRQEHVHRPAARAAPRPTSRPSSASIDGSPATSSPRRIFR